MQSGSLGSTPFGTQMTQKGGERSLDWLFHANTILTKYCPGVHLTQIHPHLSCHKAELNDAFQDWLPVLNQLKSHHDPYGLLPPL